MPSHPDYDRLWRVVDKHQVALARPSCAPRLSGMKLRPPLPSLLRRKVSHLYTAPTAIRSLMGQGDAHVRRHDLKSLRLLGSVGEPINPEAWRWYHETVGGGDCPIVDTWWQTETGAIMISPLPVAGMDQVPGSATLPFFGVQPVLLDAQGAEIDAPVAEGLLAIKAPWPSTIRSVWGDHERMESTYFPFDG